MKFKDFKDNIWLFEFADQVDKRRVMKGRPWSFDRQILVLNEFDGSTPPSKLVFYHSPFWIQAHDMPLICMNKNVSTKIDTSLGELIEVDVAGDGLGWGSYLRLRVNIDITKPLERGRALNLDGKSSWVEFKYEKLPQFCFRCGCLMHGLRGCPAPPVTRLSAAEEPKPWGSWLRAVDQRRRGFRGGAVPKEETSHNRYREEEAEDSAQLNDWEPRRGKSNSYGNPKRQSTQRTPASSVGSGTYQFGENDGICLRKEISANLTCKEATSNEIDRGISTSKTGVGQTIGPEKEVKSGLINENENPRVKEVGLV